jgi:hypothetical protein
MLRQETDGGAGIAVIRLVTSIGCQMKSLLHIESGWLPPQTSFVTIRLWRRNMHPIEQRSLYRKFLQLVSQLRGAVVSA